MVNLAQIRQNFLNSPFRNFVENNYPFPQLWRLCRMAVADPLTLDDIISSNEVSNEFSEDNQKPPDPPLVTFLKTYHHSPQMPVNLTDFSKRAMGFFWSCVFSQLEFPTKIRCRVEDNNLGLRTATRFARAH